VNQYRELLTGLAFFVDVYLLTVKLIEAHPIYVSGPEKVRKSFKLLPVNKAKLPSA
jgi:hypothetical protein